jgi:hypothetical protein
MNENKLETISEDLLENVSGGGRGVTIGGVIDGAIGFVADVLGHGLSAVGNVLSGIGGILSGGRHR